MKKLMFLLLFIVSNSILAQIDTAYDTIITKDYSIIKGTIVSITATQVAFSYPNETLVTPLELAKVAKIIFKSGRVQEFVTATTEGANPSRPAVSSGSLHTIPIKVNTIAVLPIPFVNTETLASSAENSKLAQNDMYSKLIAESAHIFPLVVQDLRETNALLKKAGIDYATIDDVPISDLQAILGVDHIIAAKVSYVINSSQTTTTYGSTTASKKSEDKVKVNDSGSSHSYQNKQFDYTVYFDIYKNATKIYSQSRVPFFSSKDSWMDSMSYLLKRCPIYSKD